MNKRNRILWTIGHCGVWGLVAGVSGCGDGKPETPPMASAPAVTSTQPVTPTVVMGGSTQPGLAPTAGLTTMEKAFMLPPSATQKEEHEGMTQEEALAQAHAIMVGDVDRTLPLERYATMGFPSPDLVWGPSEYLATASALTSLADIPQHYPRYGSPNSGKLFARMTDDANLTNLRDRSQPLEARFSTAIRLASEFEKVFAAYNRSSRPGSLLDDETLELGDFQMRLDVDMFRLIREAAAVMPDGSEARRALSQRAVEQQLQAMAQIRAYLGAFNEDLFYLPPALERFAQRLEQHLPALYPYLVSSDQITVRGMMEQIVAKATDEKVKAAMTKAVAALPAPKATDPAASEPEK